MGTHGGRKGWSYESRAKQAQSMRDMWKRKKAKLKKEAKSVAEFVDDGPLKCGSDLKIRGHLVDFEGERFMLVPLDDFLKLK